MRWKKQGEPKFDLGNEKWFRNDPSKQHVGGKMREI